MKNNDKQIKLGALLSYLSIGINIIAGLLYTPWMISQIGKSDYGLYMLGMSFIAYFIIDFGLSQSTAKFIADYRIKKEQDKINNLLGLIVKIFIVTDVLIFIALFTIYFNLEQIFPNFSEIEIEKFKVVFSIGAIYSVISFPFVSLNGILIAYERFVFLKKLQIFLKITTIFLMVIALFLGYGIYALVAVNAIVGIIIIILKWYYIIRKLKLKINYRYFDKNLLISLFKLSFWVFVISISHKLFIQIQPTLLGRYVNSSEIAIFSIAIVIEGYIQTIASALNGLFLAKVTNISKDNKSVLKLMIKIGRIQLFIIGLLIMGIIIFGKEFIVLWVGEDFKNSYYVVVLISSLGMITLTQQIGNTLFLVKQKLRYPALSSLLSSIFSIVFSFFLIPKFGAIGAGISIFISTFLFQVIITNYLFYKVLGLNIRSFFIETYVKYLPIGGGLGILGIVIQFFIPTSNLYFFIVKISLFSFMYFITIWFFIMNKSEKIIVSNLWQSLYSKIS